MMRSNARASFPVSGFIASVVGIAAAIFVIVLLANYGNRATGGVPQQVGSMPAAVPIPTESRQAPKPAIAPLPSGMVSPVTPPEDGNYYGFTAGDLDYEFYAPAYSVDVPTTTVTSHWGFTYTYQCDEPRVDDAWRLLHPDQGAFSVRLGSTWLVIGTNYNGSGYVDILSPTGGIVHVLAVSGPCSYQLNYYIFNLHRCEQGMRA